VLCARLASIVGPTRRQVPDDAVMQFGPIRRWTPDVCNACLLQDDVSRRPWSTLLRYAAGIAWLAGDWSAYYQLN
jgi:hypothetical protein